MKRFLCVAMLMTLTACGAVPPAPVVFVANCPELPQYSSEFEKELADYLARIPPSSVFDAYLVGAQKTRAQTAACIKTRQQWEQQHQAQKKH